MGVQNGGQQPGLWRRGTPVETQAGSDRATRSPTCPQTPGTGDPDPPLDAAE